MRSFSNAALADSNALTSAIPWLIFLDVALSPSIHYIRNNEDIVWNSITYNASDFDISAIPSKSTGELPEITLSIVNTAALVKDLEENYGYIGTGVTVYYVHYASVATITQANWPLKFSFKITHCDITAAQVIFTFGIPNYLKRRFPARKYRKDTCPYLYKSDHCWMKGRTVVNAVDQCNNLFEPYDSGDGNYYIDPGCKAHFDDLVAAGTITTTPSGTIPAYYTVGADDITYIPFGGCPTISKGSYRYG